MPACSVGGRGAEEGGGGDDEPPANGPLSRASSVVAASAALPLLPGLVSDMLLVAGAAERGRRSVNKIQRWSGGTRETQGQLDTALERRNAGDAASIRYSAGAAERGRRGVNKIERWSGGTRETQGQ